MTIIIGKKMRLAAWSCHQLAFAGMAGLAENIPQDRESNSNNNAQYIDRPMLRLEEDLYETVDESSKPEAPLKAGHEHNNADNGGKNNL